MKNTMKKILFLALALIGSSGHAALTEVDKSLYSERNLLPNPGFENGKNTWLSSSATLTATTTAANVLYGTASGSILISSNGGYVRSKTVAVPTGLYGQACEARVFFKGGDALTTFEVYNRDNTLLGSQTLTAQSAPGVQSVFFLCPTAAQVAGDADTGFIYSQIKQTTAGTHTVMYTDSWYMGGLSVLGEATTPDVFSAKISDSGVVSEESVDWITGNCVDSGSTGTCTLVSGIFSVAPTCVLNGVGNTTSNTVSTAITSTSSTTVVYNQSQTGVASMNLPVHLICMKQGVDAKQSVQVYKSIPKVANNINEFSAKVSSADAVSDENTDWINGNCTNGTTGRATCVFAAGTFSVTPNCQANISSTVVNQSCGIVAASTDATQVQVTCRNTNTSSEVDTAFNLSCQKQGADYKMPMVQPVVVGQIQVGATAVEATFSADLNCDAASSVTSSNLSGITVGNRSSTTCAVTLPSGFFSATPRCNFTVKATTVQATATNPTSATAVAIYGPSADYDGTLTCWGAK